MKCLFLINENLSSTQIEQQYLLMIAMLNFDFSVSVVFTNDTIHAWHENKVHCKHLAALHMYGVDTFYLLNSSNPAPNLLSTTSIDIDTLIKFKAEADFIS
jgi:hypothetical protein